MTDFHLIQTKKNIRTTADQKEFAAWLLHFSNGTSSASQDPNLAVDNKEVPQISCADGSLVDDIFNNTCQEKIRSRVIVSPKKLDGPLINEEVLRHLPDDCCTYYSKDNVLANDPTEAEPYPLEFLNSFYAIRNASSKTHLKTQLNSNLSS